MVLRPRFLFVFFLFLISSTKIFAIETEYFYLDKEPLIRIGLATNARSVSITTSDSQLVAVSDGEANKFLATNKINVAARAYRPPEIEIYNFEIQNIESQTEAEATAKEVREATGEKATASIDNKTNTWRVRIGETQETIEEANNFKNGLAEKGFEDVVIVTEKKLQPSDEAIALSEQNKNNQNSKTEVRSLIKPTGSSQPTNPKCLRDANLKLKPSKVRLFQRQIKFLGNIVSGQGIAVDDSKVTEITNWSVPRNVHEIRMFFGLCSYYRRYVKDFAAHAAPLHELTKKDHPYEWDDRKQTSFEFLKNALTTAPILATSRDEGTYILDVDASDRAMGAVLQQEQEGMLRVPNIQ